MASFPLLLQSTEIHLNVSIDQVSPDNLLEVKGGGRLVVGQKLSSIEGDFSRLETLEGDLADYRIYDGALSIEQLKEWSKCKDTSITQPPLISLLNGKLKEIGHVRYTNTTAGILCGRTFNRFNIFFTEKMNFFGSLSWCKKLKGTLALPTNEYDNEMEWASVVKYKDRCSESWTYLYWLGIQADSQSLQWQRVGDNQSLSYTNFLPVYQKASKQYECAAAVSHNKYKWAACHCEIETCVMCTFSFIPRLRLRGLCRFTLLDVDFSFRRNRNQTLVFDGMSHVQILKANGTWVLRSRRYSDLWGKMIDARPGAFPLGVHMWKIYNDKCGNDQVMAESDSFKPIMPIMLILFSFVIGSNHRCCLVHGYSLGFKVYSRNGRLNENCFLQNQPFFLTSCTTYCQPPIMFCHEKHLETNANRTHA